MAVKEDEFIVFPKKDLVGISAAQVATLDEIDQLVQLNRLRRGASQFPKFITCNQDEPCAIELLSSEIKRLRKGIELYLLSYPLVDVEILKRALE